MIYFCEMLQIKPQRHSDPLTENYYFREYTPKEISQQKQKEKKKKKDIHEEVVPQNSGRDCVSPDETVISS